jgi:hypothetical protein
METRIYEDADCLQVRFEFPSSRFAELKEALDRAASEEQCAIQVDEGQDGWSVYRIGRPSADIEYFIATAQLSYGPQPPTTVILENKRPDRPRHWRAHKGGVLVIAAAFVRECARRGCLTKKEMAQALVELQEHDPDYREA